MKQRITEKQFNELSRKQKKSWYDFMIKAGHYIGEENLDFLINGFPSIGQMIEFLVNEQPKLWRDIHIEMLHNRWQISSCYEEKWVFEEDAEKGELCDALWEAVKDVLND